MKINVHITTARNPESLSPVERFHNTIQGKLCILKVQNPNESLVDLMITEILIYNQSIHSTTKFSPLLLLYGPYGSLNDHEINLDLPVYKNYNKLRKKELLQFCEQLYKTLKKEQKILKGEITILTKYHRQLTKKYT